MMTSMGKKNKVRTASQISTLSWLTVWQVFRYTQYLGDDHKYDDEPDIGKYGGEGRDDEHREGLDPPDFPLRNAGDAHRSDGQQVEGSGAYDGAGS